MASMRDPSTSNSWNSRTMEITQVWKCRYPA